MNQSSRPHYLDNDYLAKEDYIYGIKGNWPSDVHQVLAQPIYKKNGEASYEKIVDQPGEKGEQLKWIDTKSARHIRSWQIDDGLFHGASIWGEMVRAFLKLGIHKEEIGYFGSKRLGLPCFKDVDYVLFGQRAFSIMRECIQEFKQLTGTHNITNQHVEYQSKKHGAFYNPEKNSLSSSLKNKWSSCQVKSGICSTIRFVDPLVFSHKKMEAIFASQGEPLFIEGTVIEDFRCSFIPREFLVQTRNGQYLVMTHCWIFHQCVKRGDYVQVYGNMEKDNILIVRDYIHGIRIV